MSTYRYGPLEGRGGLLGLRRGQVVLASGTAVLTVLTFLAAQALHTGAYALAPALFVAGLGFAAVAWPLPPYGRGVDQIGPAILGQAWRRLRHRDTWLTAGYRQGHTAGIHLGRSEYLIPFESKPPFLSHIELLAAHEPEAEAHSWGLLHDQLTDEYVGVIPCQGPGTALLDAAELAEVQAAYASVIADYGREEASVCAIGWVERIVPDQGEDVVRHMLSRFRDRQGLDPARENYRQLVEGARAVSQQHELFLVLVLSGKLAAGEMYRRGHGTREVGAALILRDEAVHLRRLLEAEDITAGPILEPRELAQALRVAFLPELRATRSLMERHGAEKGVPMENAWPAFVRTRMNYLEADGWYHRTYFVREWPRTEVGPDFLAPLMREAGAMRSFSVVMEPIPISRSMSEWRKREMDLASRRSTQEKLRQVHTPAQEAEERAHQELGEQIADGHVQVRFRGFVTVSAASMDELESECAEVTRAASQSRLELELMYGQQEYGFAATLPMGRGR